MSTIASSEYGDRSGAELLKMSRSEIGSGEIDVNPLEHALAALRPLLSVPMLEGAWTAMRPI